MRVTNQRRVGYAVAAAAAIGSGGWLLSWLLSPSTAARYERLQLGMTLDQCRQAVGSDGTDGQPDVTGKLKAERADGEAPPAAGRRHYWARADAVITAQFDADGALVRKVLLR